MRFGPWDVHVPASRRMDRFKGDSTMKITTFKRLFGMTLTGVLTLAGAGVLAFEPAALEATIEAGEVGEVGDVLAVAVDHDVAEPPPIHGGAQGAEPLLELREGHGGGRAPPPKSGQAISTRRCAGAAAVIGDSFDRRRVDPRRPGTVRRERAVRGAKR